MRAFGEKKQQKENKKNTLFDLENAFNQFSFL